MEVRIVIIMMWYKDDISEQKEMRKNKNERGSNEFTCYLDCSFTVGRMKTLTKKNLAFFILLQDYSTPIINNGIIEQKGTSINTDI